MSYFYTDELSHHGILGQKWGVRRFETKGGHLTAAGKARYDDGKVSEKEKHAFSAKAAAYKTLGGMHAINAKFSPTKSGRQLAKAAGNVANKKAEQAQKEADDRAANKKGLSDKQKKAIKVGAAVATTALATYGVYKVSQLNKKAKAGLSEIDRFDAKGLLDKSNDYRKNAMNLAEAARKSNKEGRADVAKSLLETSNSMLNRGNYDKASADKLLERAQKANYSLKEKATYLQSQSDSFSGTDRLIMNLLEKNKTTLSSLGF